MAIRRLACVAVGYARHASKRSELNIPELVNEAVQDAFKRFSDIKLKPEDIQVIIFGNMSPFEGVANPEMWCSEHIFAYHKPVMRISTGGTTGGTTAQAAIYSVASGMFDIAMAVSFEKQSEGDTQYGLGGILYPEIFGLVHFGPRTRGEWFGGGAGSTGGASFQALSYLKRSGCDISHYDMVAVQMRNNAMLNPSAHLKGKQPFGEGELTMEDMQKPPLGTMISYPLKFGHTCPTSEGACVMIFASENKVKKITDTPAWVNGWAANCSAPTYNTFDPVYTHIGDQLGLVKAARKAYSMAGIAYEDAYKKIHLAEVYDAWAHQQLMWIERLGLFPENQAWKYFEKGYTKIDGELPVNPSGGVVSTNAIGCTAMVRIAEAALQVMGRAGGHQVKRKVKNAVAHGWGGLFQFHTVTLLGDNPRRWR